MTPLASLLAAVDANEWPGGNGNTAREVFPYTPDEMQDHGLMAWSAFKGSTDAAISLCDAMLPGYTWTICKDFGACIWDDPDEYPPEGESDNPDPARALLIAMLRALVAMEGV